MKYSLIFLIISIFIFISCSVEKQKINFGKDKCDYCEMTIVDKRFAAELVNDKGKAFKFDAAECMLRYLDENQNKNFSLFLVTPYLKPESLIDANNSYYLISKKIPSPMGAYLSVYENLETAEKYKNKFGGQIYNWENIKSEFKKK